MLRPIDTQTIYQQTPEFSNRQHIQNHEAELQQNQFANILHKETEEKQQFVQKTEKNDQIDNDLNKNKKRGNQDAQKRKKKNDGKEEKDSQVKASANHFDIRI